MAQLSVKLFGRPAVFVGEREVPVTPQQLALVGLLYGHEREGLSRSEVTDFLWSEGTDDPLRRRLSQLLYSLAGRCGESILVRAGATLARTPTVPTDLLDFQRDLAEARFDDAAQVMLSGFLDVLPEVPTAEYQLWLDTRRRGLRQTVRAAAAKQWSMAEGQGRWGPKALSAALALQRLDPHEESAVRNVMWAQALCASPAEALATFENFMEIRPDGSTPVVSDETRTLLQRIHSLARQKRGSSPVLQPSRREPRMYGREAEVARLRPLLSDPEPDTLTTIAIAGVGGLGKTRLLSESLTAASLQGRLVLEARLAELEKDVALNALTEALSTREVAETLTRVEEPWRSVVLAFLPEFAKVAGAPIEIPQIQRSSLHRRLLESLRQLFDQIAASHSVVVVLDDFHWVDDSSLAALEYIRRRWRSGAGTLVLAYRPEHVVKGSKLDAFLSAEACEHIQLSPLDEPSQKQLTAEVGGSELDARIADRIYQLAKGNPLFLIELTRQCLDGELALADFAADDLRLPGSIQQLFDRRLVRLSSDARRVLEALAVWGRVATPADLCTLTALSEDDMATALEALDDASLVRWTDDGPELWHELLRQSVLRQTSGPRRQLLHRRAATMLRAQPEPQLVAEIALHCHRAGDQPAAALYSGRAAAAAEAVGAVPEAIYFLQVAAAGAATPSERLGLLHRLGMLLLLSCAYSEARRVILEAQLVADAINEGGMLRRLRLSLLEIDSRTRVAPADTTRALEGLWLEAEAHEDFTLQALATEQALRHHERMGAYPLFVDRALQRLSACSTDDEPDARFVAMRLGLLYAFSGRTAEADRCTAAALAACRSGLSDEALLAGLDARVAFLAITTRIYTQEGIDLLREATALALRLGDFSKRFSIANNAGAHAMECGDYQVAGRYFDDCCGIVKAADLNPEVHRLWSNLGELALGRGDFDSARVSFERVLHAASSPDDDVGVAARVGLALCDLEEGKIAAARHTADIVKERFAGAVPPLLDSGLFPWLELKLERRIAGPRSALELARTHCALFEKARPGRWIAVALWSLPLAKRLDPTRAQKDAERCLAVAQELRLRTRVDEFRRRLVT